MAEGRTSTSSSTVTREEPTNPGTPPLRSDASDIFACLVGAAKIVERVVTRQLLKDIDQGADFQALATTNDHIIDVLDQLVGSFKLGTSTVEIKAQVEKLLNAKDERTELVNNLLIIHDIDRLPEYLKLRRHIERYLQRSAFEGNLSPAEALAFLKISQTEIESITAQLRTGGHPLKDVEDLINRSDFVRKASEQELVQKFSKTTPQGREILRKIGHRIAKAARENS